MAGIEDLAIPMREMTIMCFYSHEGSVAETAIPMGAFPAFIALSILRENLNFSW